MENKNLIELASEALQIERMIMEQGGELDTQLEAWLDTVATQLSRKADSYSFVRDRLEASAKQLKERAQLFANTARALENARERLNDRIKEAIQVMEKTEVRGSDIVFKLVRTQPALKIVEAELPATYLMTVTTQVPDKERLKADLKAGASIPGATLQPSYALRVYANKEA